MSELTKRRNAERAKTAEKHMKDAQSKAKGGWFSKPDWESAARHYVDAVKTYAGLGDDFKAQHIEALKGAAKAYSNSGSEHGAATNAEKAADLLLQSKDSKEVNSNTPEAVELYKFARDNHIANDNPDRATGALFKAAKAIGASDAKDAKKDAIELFKSGLELYIEAKRGRLSDKSFKEAISWCVTQEEFVAAVELCRMQNKMIVDQELQETFGRDMYQNYLSIIVLDFHLENYAEAKKHYSEALGVEGFSSSAHGEAADNLLAANRACSQEELDAAKKHAQIKYLPVSFGRLARKLQFSAEKLAQGPEDEDYADVGEGQGLEPEEDMEDALM